MFTLIRHLAVAIVITCLASCGTTDSSLKSSGHSMMYIQGFHDGRHSGMKEAGNSYETFIKDYQRFESDSGYQQGWLAGEEEGKQLQLQAVKYGNAVGAAYTGVQVSKEFKKSTDVDKIAQDAVQGLDPESVKALE